MANYLLVFHGGGAPDTPEAQQEVMTAWTRWYDAMGDAVVDGGNPVAMSKTIASDGSVSDGGGANPASGYAVSRACRCHRRSACPDRRVGTPGHDRVHRIPDGGEATRLMLRSPDVVIRPSSSEELAIHRPHRHEVPGNALQA